MNKRSENSNLGNKFIFREYIVKNSNQVEIEIKINNKNNYIKLE